MTQAFRYAIYSAILNTEASATFMFLPVWGQHMVINLYLKLITAYPHLCCDGTIAPTFATTIRNPAPTRNLEHSYKEPSKEKKRKVYASQVQLLALRKGPLTNKLARALPRRFTGPA
eukprot:984850-Pelagomonas_calceolata.AAC.1